ncbi:hypothetical protein [Lentzea sp. E54]
MSRLVRDGTRPEEPGVGRGSVPPVAHGSPIAADPRDQPHL